MKVNYVKLALLALGFGIGIAEVDIVQWLFEIDTGSSMALAAITFAAIPQARAPFMSAEFDNAKNASTALEPFSVLAFGQKLGAGSAAADTPVQVTNGEEDSLFGEGSMAAHICKSYFKNNKFNELWVIAQDDNGSGVAAVFTVTAGGPATTSGTVNLWIKGKRVQVGVTSGDTDAEIATAIASAINADTSLPVTASAATNVATLTAKNAGEAAGDIDIRWLYQAGEKLPAGVTLALANTTAGSTDPTLTAAITAMGDQRFDVIIAPYTGTSELDALDAEVENRWDAMRALDGYWIGAQKGTSGELTTFGNARNGKYGSTLGSPSSPNACYEVAAAAAGVVAKAAELQPARPFQTLELAGILPPAKTDEFTWSVRNNLLYDGISTCTVDSGGKVRIEALITMYQTDSSFLYANKPFTMSAIRRSWVSFVSEKYPRHMLVGNNTQILPGESKVSPNTLRLETIALAQETWIRNSWMEDLDAFKETLVVEIDGTDPNRVNWSFDPNLVNQLRRAAAKINPID